MSIRNHPLSHWPALSALHALNRSKQMEMLLKKRFPATFGLPIMGPYVQCYRQDNAFRTELSLFNYFSSFLPSVSTKLAYKVVAFRRDGSLIGRGQAILEHEQSAQAALETIIGKPLDEYGLFHVQAEARSTSPTQASKLGTTTGQFMTLYCPTDPARQAPQLIHSHKLFQNIPIPHSPYTRTPSYTEDISTQHRTDFFFLNPCSTATRVVLYLHDAFTGEVLTSVTRTIHARGVEPISLTRETMPKGNNLLMFSYEFDRRISHMKPIVFRHQANSVITCNHT